MIICPVNQTGFAVEEVPQAKRFVNALDLTGGGEVDETVELSGDAGSSFPANISSSGCLW